MDMRSEFQIDSRWFEACLGWMYDTPPVQFADCRAAGPADVVDLVTSGHVVKILSEDADGVHRRILAAGFAGLEQYEAVREGDENPTVFTSLSTTHSGPGSSSFVRAISTAWHRDLYQHSTRYRGHLLGGVGRMPEIDFLLYSTVSEDRSLEFMDIAATVRSFLRENPASDLAILCQERFRINEKYYVDDPDLPNPGCIPFIYEDGPGWTAHVGGSVYGVDPAAQHVLERFMSYAQPAIRDRITSGVGYLAPATMTAHRGLRLQVNGRTTLTRRLYRREGR